MTIADDEPIYEEGECEVCGSTQEAMKVIEMAEQYVNYFFPQSELGNDLDVGGRLVKAVREYQKSRTDK